MRACVVTGFGVNADEELALAFDMAGARARRVHARDLMDNLEQLSTYQILAFPGGFSFGDHLGSGKVFATLFRQSLGSALEAFIADGGLVIGVCNGFQALVKMGFLPDLSGGHVQEVSLIHNDSGRFEDRWVKVGFEKECPCLWTRGLTVMDLPVRHGEGKLVTVSSDTLAALESRSLVALRYLSRGAGSPGTRVAGPSTVEYPDDPNGSVNHIAGICDPTGRVFGLMPHPEAFLFPENHPDWAGLRLSGDDPQTHRRQAEGQGLAVFRNGVRAARKG